MIKVATAFSGGLAACEWALKYENIEHEIVYACEWDKYARKQYLEFHGEPTSNFYEDIQFLDATKYKNKIDLFVFGSPCQDLSLAGKRKGFLGEKSSLFRHGARVLEEMMPKVFIFENVKGLLSSNKGADYKEVEKTFRDMGYHMAMKVMNAKEHGTAQNRERVFIVGFLYADVYHDFHFENPTTLTKCLRDYLQDEVDEKYYLSEKMINGFIAHTERHKQKGSGFEWKPKNKDDIANCLRANGALNTSDNSIIEEPKLKQVGELNIKGADSTKRVYSQDGLCPTMTTMGGVTDNPKCFCLL
jgi:DNA (cytosine-5)-methyltransferase 1